MSKNDSILIMVHSNDISSTNNELYFFANWRYIKDFKNMLHNFRSYNNCLNISCHSYSALQVRQDMVLEMHPMSVTGERVLSACLIIVSVVKDCKQLWRDVQRHRRAVFESAGGCVLYFISMRTTEERMQLPIIQINAFLNLYYVYFGLIIARILRKLNCFSGFSRLNPECTLR